MLKKDDFRHYYTIGNSIRLFKDNRPTMIRIIFDRYNPKTKAGINSLKVKLSTYNLNDFDQSVTTMLDSMELTYSQIIHRSKKDGEYIYKVFNALVTSDNEDLLEYMKKKQDT